MLVADSRASGGQGRLSAVLLLQAGVDNGAESVVFEVESVGCTTAPRAGTHEEEMTRSSCCRAVVGISVAVPTEVVEFGHAANGNPCQST